MERIYSSPPLPDRPLSGHKGLYGRVLVVGGNVGMLGAPAMAGRAALKLGSGLVQIAVPQSILPMVLMITPELIGIGLEDNAVNAEQLSSAQAAADAVVIGPGLGQSVITAQRVQLLLSRPGPAVVDADALNILAAGSAWPDWFKASAVLTPHPGEMKRLAKLFGRYAVPTDDDGRIDIAVTAAHTFKQVIVLKGNRTVITDGQRVYLNPTGDSSLSKAGTGDVLSGMIGCLLGQKMDPFEAACCAAYLHGRSGELSGIKLGRRCVLSHDVIDTLPDAVREYEQRFGVTAAAP